MKNFTILILAFLSSVELYSQNINDREKILSHTNVEKLSSFGQVKPNIVLEINPSTTDSRIKVADTPHYITYNPSIKQGKLLLFLAGTYGIATKGPNTFFETAVQQGYRVINLQYITSEAVARFHYWINCD